MNEKERQFLLSVKTIQPESPKLQYVQKTGIGGEMDEYEKWEKDCKRIKEQNAILLNQFADALKEQGLKKKQ